MRDVFSRIDSVEIPGPVRCGSKERNPAFEIRFVADGPIPFPQVILRHGGRELVVKGDNVRQTAPAEGDRVPYTAFVPAGMLGAGHYQVQVEGCRKAMIEQAGGDDWIKVFAEVRIEPCPSPNQTETAEMPRVEVGREAPRAPRGDRPVLYFGIHKHMHQPYYHAADRAYWDGQKDEIFGSRAGAYTRFVPAAVRQYGEGGLPHAGLSTSWSGSLIEQLDRCGAEGLCGGAFGDWSRELRDLAQSRTALGNPRCDFAAFGFFHPLMPLIPPRDIVRQIAWHRDIVTKTFGCQPPSILFPPETAFHVRMIPALNEAGIEAVIYDSIHRYRACRDYPYGGKQEGMLPPNRAEQVNPPVDDWYQLHNVWAGSKISPRLLKPEYVEYEDPDGQTHRIVAVPAERYIGNEDARGGFGALQYGDALGQLYDSLLAHDAFDPDHPPFFLLHSDGDNHGGGAESYYNHNTGRMVEWLKSEPRFELISVRDYLQKFPPDPAQAIHLEPGSWSGADNGDPQFRKWFSRFEQSYSPDLNSWAVLTALQNAVHTLEDVRPDDPALGEAQRLLLTAETSCYWYWTGQDEWDAQVTLAANRAIGMIRGAVDSIVQNGSDRTGPTIFAPWVYPENPGGKMWGNNDLADAPRQGVVHTFVHDVSGVARVTLVLRGAGGEKRFDMDSRGLYPSQTGAEITSCFFTADLPVGAGDVRYFIEAEDRKGNVSRSALERVFLA